MRPYRDRSTRKSGPSDWLKKLTRKVRGMVASPAAVDRDDRRPTTSSAAARSRDTHPLGDGIPTIWRAGQNRTEQNRTEQNRTEQNRVEEDGVKKRGQTKRGKR
jgi:hypothetical protein